MKDTSKTKGWVSKFDIQPLTTQDMYKPVHVMEVPPDAVIVEGVVACDFGGGWLNGFTLPAALIGKRVRVIVYCEEDVWKSMI